jgi:hypothetical protein
VIARGDTPRTALGLVAIACAVAYLVTPNGAAGAEGDPWAFGPNLRYAAPALALGLALLPAWAARSGARRGLGLAALLLATMLGTLLNDTQPWPDRRLEAIVIAAGLAAACALAVWLAAPRRRRIALRLALCAALALLAGGWFVQRHYEHGRYGNQLEALGIAHETGGLRIGDLGVSIHYYLYGPDLANRVEFVGQRGAHGAFTRLPTCKRWREALNAGRYRYVVVAPVVSPNLPAGPSVRPPELDWTRTDPAARLVAGSGSFGVFRLSGRLDPAGCTRA